VPRTGMSGPVPGRGPQVIPKMTRRALLALATAAALSGCSRKRPQELRPQPDVAVLLTAIATEERLIALYESTRTTHPELAGRLDPVLAHHRDHLTVLRRHYVPGTQETVDGSGGPRPGRPATPAPSAAGRDGAGTGTGVGAGDTTVAPRNLGRAMVALRTAERHAAAARSADVTRVSPGMAQLFASIGACEAGHAAWLTRLA
jgi:predicted small lipoprotein YifL